MEGLIEQYLFLHKHCPLPSVGTLEIKESAAVAWHGDNKISAPAPNIELTGTEMPAESFISFIAAKKNITDIQASQDLQKYCLDLKKLKPSVEIKLDHAGRFCIDQYGKLVFRQEPLPKEFLPSIPIQRVLHSTPASHNLRVGDTETTSVLMKEFYSDKDKATRDRWWIAALIIALITASVLVIYFQDHQPAENFGSTPKFETEPVDKTYQTR